MIKSRLIKTTTFHMINIRIYAQTSVGEIVIRFIYGEFEIPFNNFWHLILPFLWMKESVRRRSFTYIELKIGLIVV